MAKRKAVYVEGFGHKNPIPAASRIGNVIASGIIYGLDVATGKPAATLDEQAKLMFHHLEAIIEAAGGTTDDIVKLTVWMADRSQREAVNREWLAMFPDPATRPARQAMQAELGGGILVQCDFLAVIGEP
jgi:2-iminobutanoate/2-iminopropanoate deaminase